MNQGFRIMSAEAKDLYGADRMVNPSPTGYSNRTSDGNFSFKKFNAMFDYSLDSMKLQEVYEKRIRRKDFYFRYGKHYYTKNIICVTFKYSYKDFNLAGKNTYIKAGYSYRDCKFNDGIAFNEDGELIGIQTNVSVENPVASSLLHPYLSYNGECYCQIKNFTTIADKAQLRKELYETGFNCDGIHYVRYKRSSGSSRVGKVLFVNEALAADMEKWDKCGLDINPGDEMDLSGHEAYISLAMSSIIDTIEIPLDSILVIEDSYSEFEDDVVAVEIENNHLVSSEKRATIKNCIFDGQSLLDKSLFGKYEDKGMILLRNRFFKSCCFNTNIQRFFIDHDINSIDQLKGFTLAKDISQIKMITTPQSIKFLKYGSLEKWLSTVSPTFGLVKYEKPPHPFGGKLVQAHYQLFNTLNLSYEEAEEVMAPSLNYIKAIRRDPDVLRHRIKYPEETDLELGDSIVSRNQIVYKLLGINDNFAHTKMYYDFRDDLVRSEIRNLKQGHVLINGNYSTMMGNGLEMLYAAVGQFGGKSILGKGNICCSRFPDGARLLCSRSPHVTMGNILIANNVHSDMVDRYFNLTESIVVMNSIGENLLERLAGCDFDSDTILITDNKLLVSVAERNYNKFKVATNMTSAKKIKRKYTSEDKAALDVATSVNKIGEIINLSQQLNSLLWDRVNSGETIEACSSLYDDICKLSVLSNIEIDRAKREYELSSISEINILKEKYKIVDENGKMVKPSFFKTICIENGYQLSDNITYRDFKTSMDFIQRILSKFKFREGREFRRTLIPFTDMIINPPDNYRQGFYYNKCREIIDYIIEYKHSISALFRDYYMKPKDEREQILISAEELKTECIEYLETKSQATATMYLILKELDKPENKAISRFIFDIIFGKPNESFFKLINENREWVHTLRENPHGEIEFFGIRFTKVKIYHEK